VKESTAFIGQGAPVSTAVTKRKIPALHGNRTPAYQPVSEPVDISPHPHLHISFLSFIVPSVTRWVGRFNQCSDKATGSKIGEYGLDFSQRPRFFSPSLCADRLLDSPMNIRGSFARGKVVQLTSHLHVVQKAKMEFHLHYSIFLPYL
jgi:hypothetical protein